MSTHDVLTYGAVGDGQTNDAHAIQAAIDACHAAGGGTVLLPAGRTYFSGSLELRGQTEFRVERGATLLASPNYADYRPEHFSDIISGGLIDTDSELSRRAWLTAFEAHDLSITGGGVIDGHGRAFILADLGGICQMRGPQGEEQYQARPYSLNLIGCQRLDMGGLTIRDGAYWTLRLTGCQDVTISHLRLQKGEHPIGQQDFRPPHGLVNAPTHGVTVNGASEVTLRHVRVEWGQHRDVAFAQALHTQRAAGLIVDEFSGEDAPHA